MKKLAVIICVLVVVLGSLFIWNSYQKSDSVDLRVACNLTITGDFGLYGESIQKGILMAQEDLNDSAIANNVKVVYDFIDNASDTKNAVTIYNKATSANTVWGEWHNGYDEEIDTEYVVNPDDTSS